MELRKFDYGTAKPFDLWYVKNGKLLLYLGEAKNRSLWLWVGTMMADYEESRFTNTRSYHPIDEDWVMAHLEEHFNVLTEGKETAEDWEESGLLLTQWSRQNLVGYLGNWEFPAAAALAKELTRPQRKKKAAKVLEPGRVYRKLCVDMTAYYLYCGKRTIELDSYRNNIRPGRRTVHLFHSCTWLYRNKEVTEEVTEEELLADLMDAIRHGYDYGHFVMNLSPDDLYEEPGSCQIPGNPDDCWILGRSSGTIWRGDEE